MKSSAPREVVHCSIDKVIVWYLCSSAQVVCIKRDDLMEGLCLNGQSFVRRTVSWEQYLQMPVQTSIENPTTMYG